MKRRLAVLALGALGVTALPLAFTSAPLESVAPPAPAPRARPEAAPPPEASATLSRNPFEFGGSSEEARGLSVRPSPIDRPAPVLAPPPAAPPVRLVGLVHRAGGVRAALVVDGELGLVEVGETFHGFTLLSADDENGVRLRGPDGAELALAAEPS